MTRKKRGGGLCAARCAECDVCAHAHALVKMDVTLWPLLSTRSDNKRLSDVHQCASVDCRESQHAPLREPRADISAVDAASRLTNSLRRLEPVLNSLLELQAGCEDEAKAHAMTGVLSRSVPKQAAPEPSHRLGRSIARARASFCCDWTGVPGHEWCGRPRGPQSGPLCSVCAGRESHVARRARGYSPVGGLQTACTRQMCVITRPRGCVPYCRSAARKATW